jgi:hypothetical protein
MNACRFEGVEGLKSHFLLKALMRDKNLLHFINKRQISFINH